MQFISRLDRYVGYEIMRIFMAILVVLLLVMVGSSLFKMLRLAATGSVSPDSVLTLLWLEIFRLSGRLIPVSFFFATVFALGRMYQEQEMTALFSSGFSPWRLFRVIFLVSIPMALISAWLVLTIYPQAGRIVEQVQSEYRDAILLSSMEGGRFYEAREGEMVFYAEASNIDTGELKDVFLHQRNADGSVSVTVAGRGVHLVEQEGQRREVILSQGHQYNGVPGGSEAAVVEFETFNIIVNAKPPAEAWVRLKTVDTLDLVGDDSIEAQVELQGRLIFPLSLIAFGFLAVPLSRSEVRQSAYLRIVFAILAYLVFTGLTSSAETWMLAGVTPAWMGLWWVVALMLFVAVWLVAQEQLRFRRRRLVHV